MNVSPCAAVDVQLVITGSEKARLYTITSLLCTATLVDNRSFLNAPLKKVTPHVITS